MTNEKSSANAIKQNKISTNLTIHILLTALLGIFWLWPWVYKTTALLNDVKEMKFRKPSSELALSILVPFYSAYWFNQTAKRIEFAGKQANNNISFSCVCTFLALFVPGVASILIEMEIENLSGIEVSLSKETKSTATETINYKELPSPKTSKIEPNVKKEVAVVIKEKPAPKLQEENKLLCPHCKEGLDFMGWESGEKVECPFCSKELVV